MRMKMINLVNRAMFWARAAHDGQTRKDGTSPYIDHPDRVVRILWKWGFRNSNVLAAAWLHDTVEDTYTTIRALEDNFGSGVSEIVRELTNLHTGNRAERVAKYTLQLCNASSAATVIKLADILDNVYDSVGMDPKFALKWLHEKMGQVAMMDTGRFVHLDAQFSIVRKAIRERYQTITRSL